MPAHPWTPEQERDIHERAKAELTRVARQLAFVGLGASWIFRGNAGQAPALPRILVASGALLVFSLTLDFIQLVVDLFHSRLSRLYRATDVVPPKQAARLSWLDRVQPVDKLLYVKGALLAVGYVLLLIFLSMTVATT